jgi:hypothetical protein
VYGRGKKEGWILLKMVWLWILLPIFAVIIVAYLFYQEISYKSGKLIILKPYVPNEQMAYEVAYYGVTHATFEGEDIIVIIDSYGSGPTPGEKDPYYYYLAKDNHKVRRIRTSLDTLKKGDIIEITYKGSMRE